VIPGAMSLPCKAARADATVQQRRTNNRERLLSKIASSPCSVVAA